MSEQDFISLYSGKLLALAAEIPHLGHLPAPDAKAKDRAPMCGSTIAVELNIENTKITAFAQQVQACALGQASAAILGEVVIGRTLAELEQARVELKQMLADNGPVPQAPFNQYEVLRAAQGYTNRHGSILLALDVTISALKSAHPQPNS